VAERYEAVARRISGYEHEMRIAGTHTLTADEPENRGGTDKGATPMGLLIAALGSCTAITTEMYANRKGWDLGTLEVQTRAEIEGYLPTRFRIGLNLPDDLSAEQVERLLTIAARCPVRRSLSSEIDVEIVAGALED
jgi:putative redox protein